MQCTQTQEPMDSVLFLPWVSSGAQVALLMVIQAAPGSLGMLEFTGFTRWTNIRFVYWSVKSGSLESLKEGRTSTDIAPLLVKLHPFPLICCADVTISLVHRENLSVSVPQMCSVFRCCCFMSVFKKVLINRQATGHYKKLLFMLDK